MRSVQVRRARVLPMRVVGVAVAAVVLAGCAGNPDTELRDAVADVTAEANDRDADGLRRAVDDLLDVIDKQTRDGVLGTTESASLTALAEQLLVDAALIDEAPEPSESPTPSPTEEEPEPSESPSPTPSRSPSPSPPPPPPSPTPSRSPSPQPSPSESGIEDVIPSPASTQPSPSSSPAQAGGSASPSGSAAAT